MLAAMSICHWTLLLITSLLLSAHTQVDAAPTPGERLAPLRLPTIDGKTHALHAFRGKKLLLIEFASW